MSNFPTCIATLSQIVKSAVAPTDCLPRYYGMLLFEIASMTSLREQLTKIGAKVPRFGRSVMLRMAHVAVPWHPFADILPKLSLTIER